MKLFEYIQYSIIGVCVSFTVELIAFVILPDNMVPTLTDTVMLQTFVICVCGSFMALLPACFVSVWSLKGFALSYCLLMLTIFGIGHYVFQLIPIEWESAVGIIGCSFMIYAVCFFTMYKKEQLDAEEINKHLAKTHKNRK